MIPTVETDRLILRAHGTADYDACVALWADPITVRHISGVPSTPTQTWMRLLTYPGLWGILGFGYWAVEERATGTYIGDVGFADFRREIVPSIAGFPELGWVISPRVHGKGYATEAARAALAWADRNIDVPHRLHHRPGNRRSGSRKPASADRPDHVQRRPDRHVRTVARSSVVAFGVRRRRALDVRRR